MTDEQLERIPYPSARKKEFYSKYGHLTDSEINKEILYFQSVQIDKIERTRKNTSILVWFLVAMPFILGATAFLFKGLMSL